MEKFKPEPPETKSDEEKYKSKIANELAIISESINFGEGRTLSSVSNPEEIKEIREAGLGQDSRVTTEESSNVGSVLDGLDFDEERLRSQIFVLKEENGPIGVMTLEIAPRNYIQSLRYLKKTEDGLKLVDFHEISGGLEPKFMIIPAWTEIIKEARANLSLAKGGIKAFDAFMEVLIAAAPEGTVIESVAQGSAVDIIDGETRQDGYKKHKTLKELSSNELGSIIPYNNLPFDIEQFAMNGKGSSATVKNALRIGLKKVPNVASGTTLGPVFLKEVKGEYKEAITPEELVEKYNQEVAEFFDTEPLKDLDIKIFNTKQELFEYYKNLTGIELTDQEKEWLVAFSPGKTVAILSPNILTARKEISPLIRFQKLIKHELVHKYIYKRSGKSPSWLVEGICQHVADQEKEIIDTSKITIDYLKKLSTKEGDPEGYRYAVGKTIVDLIVRYHGEKKLIALLELENDEERNSELKRMFPWLK